MPQGMPIAAYGSWPSPLASAVLARGHVRYGFTTLTAEGTLYWSELRSADQGRSVVVELNPDGTTRDVLPAPFSARTRVHEYGGRSFLIAESKLWFVNQTDQQVYELELSVPQPVPRQLTHTSELRFAELTYDARRKRILAIAERHDPEDHSHASVQNFIVAIALETGAVERVIEGRDFFAGLALSPDGSQLAYRPGITHTCLGMQPSCISHRSIRKLARAISRVIRKPRRCSPLGRRTASCTSR
jgi:hypothetical protein